jgi:hypothetical protein
MCWKRWAWTAVRFSILRIALVRAGPYQAAQ